MYLPQRNSFLMLIVLVLGFIVDRSARAQDISITPLTFKLAPDCSTFSLTTTQSVRNNYLPAWFVIDNGISPVFDIIASTTFQFIQQGTMIRILATTFQPFPGDSFNLTNDPTDFPGMAIVLTFNSTLQGPYNNRTCDDTIEVRTADRTNPISQNFTLECLTCTLAENVACADGDFCVCGGMVVKTCPDGTLINGVCGPDLNVTFDIECPESDEEDCAEDY